MPYIKIDDFGSYRIEVTNQFTMQHKKIVEKKIEGSEEVETKEAWENLGYYGSLLACMKSFIDKWVMIEYSHGAEYALDELCLGLKDCIELIEKVMSKE